MKLAVLPLLLLGMAGPAWAGPLALINETDSGLLNILVKLPEKELFLRVDLLPGGKEAVENPGGRAALRVDTGLEFWNFPPVGLADSKSLTFCKEHGICLLVAGSKGSRHIQGQREPLAPGNKPVCSLDNFHPAMTMGQVCAILPEKMPQDDNGALLTPMGFGGLTWAARLVPVQAGPVTPSTQLEHLELRRRLDADDVARLLDTLMRRGYTPWQAELPGIELAFGPNADARQKKEILIDSLAGFLAAHSQKGHKNHALKEKCDDASIILAPAKLLPALENADAPPEDLEIYTIVIRPCTGLLLLDVAAYHGDK